MSKRAVGIAIGVALVWFVTILLPVAQPADATVTAYKFAVGGDDHYKDKAYPAANGWGNESRAYMAALKEDGVQRFFEVGDLTQEQGPRAYSELAAIYNSSGIPYNVVLGNHDKGYLPFGCQRILNNTGLPYTVDVGPVVFIMMHAVNMTNFNSSTISWLGVTLAQHRNQICFIMMHIMHKKLGYPSVEMEDAGFTALVEAHANHIGAVIAGHIHEYRTPHTYVVNGVHYTYSGTIGEGYLPMNPSWIYSYLTVEMSLTIDGWDLHLYRKDFNSKAIVPGTEDFYSIGWSTGSVNELHSLALNPAAVGGIGIASIVVMGWRWKYV